jgi:HEPN domain-containing protein
MTIAEVENWLQRAESNLRIARMGQAEGVFLEDLCFETQQAAEKALKALLIWFSGEYPRVHAFTRLLERLGEYVPIPSSIAEVVELTDYAVQTRYPGDYYRVTAQEYERAIELATRVLCWVREQIASPKV